MIIYIPIESLHERNKERPSGKAGSSSVQSLSGFSLCKMLTPFFQQIYTVRMDRATGSRQDRRNGRAGLPLDGSTQHRNNIPAISIQLFPWALWRREWAQEMSLRARGTSRDITARLWGAASQSIPQGMVPGHSTSGCGTSPAVCLPKPAGHGCHLAFFCAQKYQISDTNLSQTQQWQWSSNPKALL